MLHKKSSQERIEKKLQRAKATLAIEGQYLTKEEEKLLKERHEGKINESEFLRKALELAQNG